VILAAGSPRTARRSSYPPLHARSAHLQQLDFIFHPQTIQGNDALAGLQAQHQRHLAGRVRREGDGIRFEVVGREKKVVHGGSLIGNG
jgi:hypothetical protein